MEEISNLSKLPSDKEIVEWYEQHKEMESEMFLKYENSKKTGYDKYARFRNHPLWNEVKKVVWTMKNDLLRDAQFTKTLVAKKT